MDALSPTFKLSAREADSLAELILAGQLAGHPWTENEQAIMEHLRFAEHGVIIGIIVEVPRVND